MMRHLVRGGNGKWDKVIEGIGSHDRNSQVLALNQLHDWLSYATEESVDGFPEKSFMVALMKVLDSQPAFNESIDSPCDGWMEGPFHFENAAEDAHRMLLAANCLYMILDVIPHFSRIFIQSEYNLSVLTRKLSDIQYIDLAEKILQIIEKLTEEQPVAVLHAGGLESILNFIDFFPMIIQRKAAKAASQMLSVFVSESEFTEKVLPVAPVLCELLAKNDEQLLEMICTGWKNLVNTVVSVCIPCEYGGDTPSGKETECMEVVSMEADQCSGETSAAEAEYLKGYSAVRSIFENIANMGLLENLCKLMTSCCDDTIGLSTVRLLMDSVYVVSVISRFSDAATKKAFCLGLSDICEKLLRLDLAGTDGLLTLQVLSLGLSLLPSVHYNLEAINAFTNTENELNSVELLSVDTNRLKIFQEDSSTLKILATTFLSRLVSIYDDALTVETRNQCLSLLLSFTMTISRCNLPVGEFIAENTNGATLFEFLSNVLNTGPSGTMAIAVLSIVQELLKSSSKLVYETLIRHGVVNGIYELVGYIRVKESEGVLSLEGKPVLKRGGSLEVRGEGSVISIRLAKEMGEMILKVFSREYMDEKYFCGMKVHHLRYIGSVLESCSALEGSESYYTMKTHVDEGCVRSILNEVLEFSCCHSITDINEYTDVCYALCELRRCITDGGITAYEFNESGLAEGLTAYLLGGDVSGVDTSMEESALYGVRLFRMLLLLRVLTFSLDGRSWLVSKESGGLEGVLVGGYALNWLECDISLLLRVVELCISTIGRVERFGLRFYRTSDVGGSSFIPLHLQSFPIKKQSSSQSVKSSTSSSVMKNQRVLLFSNSKLFRPNDSSDSPFSIFNNITENIRLKVKRYSTDRGEGGVKLEGGLKDGSLKEQMLECTSFQEGCVEETCNEEELSPPLMKLNRKSKQGDKVSPMKSLTEGSSTIVSTETPETEESSKELIGKRSRVSSISSVTRSGGKLLSKRVEKSKQQLVGENPQDINSVIKRPRGQTNESTPKASRVTSESTTNVEDTSTPSLKVDSMDSNSTSLMDVLEKLDDSLLLSWLMGDQSESAVQSEGMGGDGLEGGGEVLNICLDEGGGSRQMKGLLRSRLYGVLQKFSGIRMKKERGEFDKEGLFDDGLNNEKEGFQAEISGLATVECLEAYIRSKLMSGAICMDEDKNMRSSDYDVGLMPESSKRRGERGEKVKNMDCNGRRKGRSSKGGRMRGDGVEVLESDGDVAMKGCDRDVEQVDNEKYNPQWFSLASSVESGDEDVSRADENEGEEGGVKEGSDREVDEKPQMDVEKTYEQSNIKGDEDVEDANNEDVDDVDDDDDEDDDEDDEDDVDDEEEEEEDDDDDDDDDEEAVDEDVDIEDVDEEDEGGDEEYDEEGEDYENDYGDDEDDLSHLLKTTEEDERILSEMKDELERGELFVSTDDLKLLKSSKECNEVCKEMSGFNISFSSSGGATSSKSPLSKSDKEVALYEKEKSREKSDEKVSMKLSELSVNRGEKNEIQIFVNNIAVPRQMCFYEVLCRYQNDVLVNKSFFETTSRDGVNTMGVDLNEMNTSTINEGMKNRSNKLFDKSNKSKMERKSKRKLTVKNQQQLTEKCSTNRCGVNGVEMKEHLSLISPSKRFIIVDGIPLNGRGGTSKLMNDIKGVEVTSTLNDGVCTTKSESSVWKKNKIVEYEILGGSKSTEEKGVSTKMKERLRKGRQSPLVCLSVNDKYHNDELYESLIKYNPSSSITGDTIVSEKLLIVRAIRKAEESVKCLTGEASPMNDDLLLSAGHSLYHTKMSIQDDVDGLMETNKGENLNTRQSSNEGDEIFDVMEGTSKLLEDEKRSSIFEEQPELICFFKLLLLLYNTIEVINNAMKYSAERLGMHINPTMMKYVDTNIVRMTSTSSIFVSNHLTSKLIRQLCDCAASLSYKLPQWISLLLEYSPFLFSFDSRKLFFLSNCVGCQRGLNLFKNRLKDAGELLGQNFSNAASRNTQTPRRVEGYAGQGLILSSVANWMKSSRLNQRIQKGIFAEAEQTLNIPRKKVRLQRSHVLEGAVRIMDHFHFIGRLNFSLPIMEIEYFNEEGIGSGPTLEFYTEVIERLKHFKSPTFFRSEMSSNGGVLFPQPYACRFVNIHPKLLERPTSSKLGNFTSEIKGTNQQISKKSKASETASSTTASNRAVPSSSAESTALSSTNLESTLFAYFKTLGQLCAKALLDGRVIDLRFHPIFWEYVTEGMNGSYIADLATFARVDPAAALSLRKLLEMRNNGENVESVGLDFTLLGSDPPIELLPDGANRLVTNDTLDEYIKLVCSLSLYEGIALQVWAFRFGMSSFMPIWGCRIFSNEELSEQFLGTSSDDDAFWKLSHLKTYIIPDHGYNAMSKPYLDLLQTLFEFTKEERRSFLIFCTGSPALPGNGFASLRPLMKVVKKEVDKDIITGKMLLPSVMTCSNYLKLPNYSDHKTLEERLKFAMREGQGAFTLS